MFFFRKDLKGLARSISLEVTLHKKRQKFSLMHIGSHIREVFDNGPKTWTVTWFARELNCDRRNVYNIFARHSIDTELLMRISKILQHNFFADLGDETEL